MIRTLVIDDHPALRAGLQGLLAGEPGIDCVGAVAGTAGLPEVLERTRPAAVVLDYALGIGDGLSTCFRLKQRREPPAVVLYSAYADDVFAVPAAIAQADAVVAKSAPVQDLLEAIRDAASGRAARPALDPETMEAASARLHADDLPVAGMLLGAVPVGEIAATLGLTVADVESRALRIIGRLQARDRLMAATPA